MIEIVWYTIIMIIGPWCDSPWEWHGLWTMWYDTMIIQWLRAMLCLIARTNQQFHGVLEFDKVLEKDRTAWILQGATLVSVGYISVSTSCKGTYRENWSWLANEVKWRKLCQKVGHLRNPYWNCVAFTSCFCFLYFSCSDQKLGHVWLFKSCFPFDGCCCVL